MNLCTDNIPDTSPFLASGNNNRYVDLVAGLEGCLSLNSLSLLVRLHHFLVRWFSFTSERCKEIGKDRVLVPNPFRKKPV
jgi:hypothetical protein